MANAEDYPYDPRADGTRLDGLDKLRAVADRKLAKMLFDLFPLAQRNGQSASFERVERERVQLAEDERLANLESMADKALNGDYDRPSQVVARQWAGEHPGHGEQQHSAGNWRNHSNRGSRDAEALRILMVRLQKVPGRRSG